MRKFLVHSGLCVLILTSACNRELHRIEKSGDPEKKLDYANKLYDKKKYATAQQLYEELRPVYKGTDKFEDINYRNAYCSYNLRDYVQAAFLFKNYLDAFPNSPRAQEVDYMQAYCYYKQSPKVPLDQTNTIKAISALQTFINEFPNGDKVPEANLLIELCRKKLEQKEFNAAELYFNLGYYKAANIAFKSLMRNYPDSDKSDGYKLYAIRSSYRYAQISIPEKQLERYQAVLTEYMDFNDHYGESKLKPDAEKYYNLAQNNIKNLEHEQNKAKSAQ